MYRLGAVLGCRRGHGYRAGILATLTTGAGLPRQTLAVGAFCSVAMGLMLTALKKVAAAPLSSALSIIRVLGGFTTFLTLSMDTVLLYEQGGWRTV